MEQLLDVHRGQPKRRPSNSRHSRQADAAREEGGDKAPSQTNRNGGAGEPTVEMSPGGTRGLCRNTRKHQTRRQLPQLSPTRSDQ